MSEIVLIPDFIDEHNCATMMAAFNAAKPMPTDSPFFDDMIIYLQAVEDTCVRQIMLATRDRILKLLKRRYQVDELYCDSLMLCRWPVGKTMPPHVDNQTTHHYSTPWRTHSAILYLNNCDSGGELYFTKFNLEIKPRFGLLVAFPSGAYFEHGVRSLRGGTRYTMPCWFTNDAARRMPS